MQTDCIQIDDARLQANLQAYLRTPAAARIFEAFDAPWLVHIVVVGTILVVGCGLLPTIIWTWEGLRTLYALLSYSSFARSMDVCRHPETLQAILAHGVVFSADRRHVLVLGTFLPSSDCSIDWLAGQAVWLGKLHSTPEPGPEFRELWGLLRDDTYCMYRRRRVPEPHHGGKALYLLDVEVDPSQSLETPHGTVLYAFAAKPGNFGEILQLPWSVTQGAVRVA